MTSGEPHGEVASSGCTLDPSGLNEQLARYVQLGELTSDIDRTPGRVGIRFAETLDPGLLDRTLAVERSCCPFLATSFDDDGRQLTISAESAEGELWLDRIFDALTRARLL